MNADGSGQRRVAEFGFHPSFTPNGKSTIFTRGSRIVRLDLAKDTERVLLDVATPPDDPLGDRVYEPDFSRGRLAITVRGKHRAFGIFELKHDRFRRFAGPSCQIAWWPGGKRLYWVENTGHGGNRIVAGDAEGSAAQTLLDLPGQYSHEYFPRLGRDQKWLVLGASTGGHEHDRADYEIFLWKVGDPAERALRVTHHSGNDQWPDVLAEPADR
jgi:hypothetical protein